jgi:anti-sigma regulatory factor (Ser/Thr protein kinase)
MRSVIEIALRLPATLSSVGAARRSVETGLDDFVDRELLDSSALVVSELVTNSLRHGVLAPNASIEVRVTADGNGIRVEVIDRGIGFDPSSLRRPEPEASGGWGLFLVDQLSSRWGVSTDGVTRVWAEIPASPA